MKKVDIEKLSPSHLRAFYLGYIDKHQYFPKDFKEAIKRIMRQHFQIMVSEIGLIELAWRRNKPK